jgi:hypothetical protein
MQQAIIIQNISNEELQSLRKIASQLQTQNNKSTQNPLFVVYELKETIFNQDYGHRYISQFNKDTWNEYELDDEWYTEDQIDERLDDYNYDSGLELTKDDLEVCENCYRDEFCQAFLTEAGAKEYIRINGHNLNKPYIWCESLHRNEEMILLRKVLMSLES